MPCSMCFGCEQGGSRGEKKYINKFFLEPAPIRLTPLKLPECAKVKCLGTGLETFLELISWTYLIVLLSMS